jgi:hypothetical protein|tara:strand:+ start:528 stop:812 length:285 start_codon:yes stop_codon:yes gene_type:complete
MKIRDIEDKEIRELAIDNCQRGHGYESELVSAFDWFSSKEGHEFWSDINKGNIPKTQRELKLEQGLKEHISQLIDAGYREDSLLILSITNLLEV